MAYGEYRKKWGKWLSTKRIDRDLSNSKIITKDSREQECRSPIESDIGRIIFSQPFRRLAGKTQVHPFSAVDYVHNRLTHSMEVGYVSYELGKRLASFMLKIKGDLWEDSQINEVGLICQAAGLMHDIGNPPYGHAGEDAIRAWASQKQNQSRIRRLCGEPVLDDLMHFDGNAQAFRMASNPEPRETGYFKLSLSVLGAMVKYPFGTNSKMGKTTNKSAAFSSEKEIFDCLMAELDLKESQRHPLSYITEAADDICYRISDFEDAVLMGIMDEESVRNLFLEGMSFECRQKLKGASLQRVKAKSIGGLIDAFASAFECRYEDIVTGRMEGGLKSAIDERWGGVLARIKQQYESIFSERKKVVAEIGSYGQMECVLGQFLGFLSVIRENRKVPYAQLPFIFQRLVTLAWGGSDYYEHNNHRDASWWMHAVLDFVVGMTDGYLHKLSLEM